jgi:hypothetical protein
LFAQLAGHPTERNNVKRGLICDEDPALPVLIAPIKPLKNRSSDFSVIS